LAVKLTGIPGSPGLAQALEVVLLKRSTTSSLLGALVIALFVFFLHFPQTQDGILFDDAADYMRAARAPIVSTWLNTNSVTPLELFHLRRHDPEFSQHPWFLLYTMRDNAALRHFHTPISSYILHIVRGFFSTDQCARVLWSTAGAFLCGLLYFILAESSTPLIVAALIALFAGVQASFIEVSVDPTPHVWYLLFGLGFLYLFARYLSSHRARDIYLAAVLLAFAVATLEFSLELILAIPLALATLWFIRREVLPARSIAISSALKAFGVFFASTFVIWPGGWIRGGYLECYGILSASVLQRNKGPQHTQHLATKVFGNASNGHTSVWVLVAVGVAAGLWLLFRKRLSIPSIVFASCAIFAFCLGVADHFILNTFFFESAVILMAAVGFILGDLFTDLSGVNGAASSSPGWVRPACIAVVCILLLVGSALELRPQLRSESWGTRAWLGDVFAGVRQLVPAGATVIAANNREALSLYLPEYHFVFAPDYHTPPDEIIRMSSSSSLWRPGEEHYGVCILREFIPEGAETLGEYPASKGNNEFLWRAR
jgi:hypothetical protein